MAAHSSSRPGARANRTAARTDRFGGSPEAIAPVRLARSIAS